MEKEINLLIGQRIKQTREKARLTQEQLSEILDCTPQYISLIENGRYGISLKMLRKLCIELNISSDSLLFPESCGNSLTFINYRCKDLTDEQFRLLLEIINRYIEAVTL